MERSPSLATHTLNHPHTHTNNNNNYRLQNFVEMCTSLQKKKKKQTLTSTYCWPPKACVSPRAFKWRLREFGIIPNASWTWKNDSTRPKYQVLTVNDFIHYSHNWCFIPASVITNSWLCSWLHSMEKINSKLNSGIRCTEMRGRLVSVL